MRQRWLAALAEGKRWAEIAHEFDAQLAKLPESRDRTAPRVQLIVAVIRRHDPVFQALRALHPKDTLLPLSQARDFVLRSDWENAARTYTEVIDEVPLWEEWYECCAALLLAGKPENYRDLLKRLVDQAGDVKDPFLAYVLARTSVLTPQTIVPPSQVVEWANLAAESPQSNAWYWHVAGLAQSRTATLRRRWPGWKSPRPRAGVLN